MRVMFSSLKSSAFFDFLALALFLLADSAEATFCVGKGVIAGFETCSQAGALLRQAARSAVIIAKTFLVLSSMVVIKKVPSVLL